MNSNWSYSPGTPNLGQNRQFFLAVWPWNLTDDLEKQQGTSSKQHRALCIISSPYVNSNWSYDPDTAKWGHDLCDLDLWPLTFTFCMDITFVTGNNSGKFQDNMMRGTLSKRCDRQTDGQTDRRTDGNKCSLSCLVAAKNTCTHLSWLLRWHWNISTKSFGNKPQQYTATLGANLKSALYGK